MKINDLIKKFNIDVNLPEIILNYETHSFDKFNKEIDDNGIELYVFTTENEKGDTLEGVLVPSKKEYYEFSIRKGSDIRYSHGGVNENGIFI